MMLNQENNVSGMSIMSKSEFLRVWSRESVNQPGIMVETVALTKELIHRKPILRKDAVA